MKEDWIKCCFEDLLDYEQPTKYIVKNTKYSDSYTMPVLTAGKSFIKGYTNETDGIFDNLPTIIFDDFTTATQFVNFKFKVKSSAMKILVPTSKLVNLPFVYHLMQVNQVRSDTHKRYWISVFAKKEILLPSFVEQNAILAKIEQLFSSLDSGIADLKKSQAQLKIYRQAVLKKAFEGELTKEWREKNKIKFDWKNTTTGEIMPDISSGSTPKAEFLFKEGEIQFLKVYNLNFDGSLNEKKNPAFTTYNIHSTSNKRAITKAGDVLINIVGPPLGKTSMIPLNCKLEFNINQAIVRFRPNENILPKFLSFFMQNPETVNWLEGTSKATAGQYNVKVTTCRVIPISLPIINEQTEIVREIEFRLSVCDNVEQSITESLEKSKALRQSILKKAFEGKLLSVTEIAECKADAAYEPASVLLEKVRAEKLIKETASKKIKTKKKKITKKKPSVPAKISTDIQAGVIAKVIQLHIDNPKHLDNLTHVKCEKISHLVEYHLQIPLGRVPVKDAAGPDDYNHLKKVEHRANMAGYFKVIKKEIGHTYTASRNINKAIDNLEKKISTEQKEQMNNLIKLFLNFDLESAEIIATLYAGWNNLLIDGKTPTDDEIVYESRENWSKRKLTIQRERFYKALNWMRKDEITLIPIGFGAKVLKPNKQK